MTTSPATSSHRRGRAAGVPDHLLRFVLVASCAFALCLLGFLPAPAARASGAVAHASTSSSVSSLSSAAVEAQGLRLALVSASPMPAKPGTGVKVSVRVTNTTKTKISGRKATLEVGTNALDSLGAQKRWSEGTASPARALSVETTLPDLAAGAATTVQLAMPAGKLDLRYTMATLPTRVSVGEAQLRTFITWVGSAASFDTSVSTSLVIPVTLPNDPALLTASGSVRFEAWKKAIGPGSAIDTLLSSNPGAPVTWLIDPAVLDPAEAQDGRLPQQDEATQDDASSSSSPSASSTASSSAPPSASSTSSSTGSSTSSSSASPTGASGATSSGAGSTASEAPGASGASGGSKTTSTPGTTGSSGTAGSSETTSSGGSASENPSDSSSPSTASSSPTTVEELAALLRSKLASRPDSQQILFTPYGDPDLSSLTSASRPAGSDTVLARALARPLSAELQKLSTQMVAAPVSPLDGGSTERLVAAWKKARGGATPTVLTSSISLDGSSLAGVTSAARRTTSGVPMLGYDPHLSRLLSDTTSPDAVDDASSAASLEAASLASYQQAPRTSRSALLMGSRGITTPSRLAAVIAVVKSAPWLDPTALDLSAAARATADVTLAARAPSSEDVWPRPGAPAFDASDLTTAGRTLGTLTDMARMVDDGDDIVPAWTRNLDQATSTRWRDHSAQVDSLVQHARTTVEAIPLKVSVVPSRVNFFADSGVITVTVKNELARRVRDVSLSLIPRSYGVTFRDQPRPVDIAAGSQTSLRVGAVAHTSGRVPVETRLTSATGITLGGTDDGSTVLEINARPTGTWIFWVLGIVALLVFCYGLVRYRQKGTRRRDELAQEIQ